MICSECKQDCGEYSYPGCVIQKRNDAIMGMHAEIARLQKLIQIADVLITNENAQKDWEDAKRIRVM